MTVAQGLIQRLQSRQSRLRRPVVFVVAAAVGAFTALPAQALTLTSASAAYNQPAFEQQLFNLTNQDRAATGLPPLAWNGSLASIARGDVTAQCGAQTVHGRSRDMIERDYFAHQIPPCSQYVWGVFNLGSFQAAGENIGWNNYPTDQSVSQMNTALMKSPEHKANILGDYNQIGVGVYQATGAWSDGSGTYQGVLMYTEIFLRGATTSAAPAPIARPATPTHAATTAPTHPPTAAVQQAQAAPTPDPTPSDTASPTADPLALAPENVTMAPHALAAPAVTAVQTGGAGAWTPVLLTLLSLLAGLGGLVLATRRRAGKEEIQP